jgi:hypothetical protein
MNSRSFFIAAATAAAASTAWSQGAVRPIEAVVVNPESRPVPVVDKPLAAAIGALASGGNRTPYQHAVRFNQSMTTCTQFVCEVNFPAVPAGKLLVVTYASARYSVDPAQASPAVELRDAANVNDTVLLPAPVPHGLFGSVIAAGPVTFHVAGGRTPRLALGGTGVGLVSNTALASIVGHLIDAPQ